MALDFCCSYIGLVFIKDRPVSSFWVLRFRVLGVFVFEFWVLCFRVLGCFVFDLGCFVFDLGCFVFEIWVLRFRDLGASFSRLGSFVLRSSFSSVLFSTLPCLGLPHVHLKQGARGM